MRLALQPHHDFPPGAAAAIEVEVGRPASDMLTLGFRLIGSIASIVIPDRRTAERTDGLWQHSCFEAFVSAGPHAGYHEANLSPSTEWAGYHFEGYRIGMRPALGDPGITFTSSGDEMELSATLRGLPAGDWHVGLSAVIEAKDGSRSYWALRHPPGKPDFHHRDCFALQLPPAAEP